MRILPSQSTRHEAEGRIDRVVHHGRGDAVALDDRLPIMHGRRRPADRCRSCTPDARIASMSTTLARSVDVGRDVVVAMDAGGLARALVGNAAARRRARRSRKPLAALLDPAGDVGVGRPAIGRIVFEAAILGRIVRRRDDDAVGQAVVAARDCRSGWRARSPASACSRHARRSSSRRRWRRALRARSRSAGSDSACVSMPMNSGPSMPACLR